MHSKVYHKGLLSARGLPISSNISFDIKILLNYHLQFLHRGKKVVLRKWV